MVSKDFVLELRISVSVHHASEENAGYTLQSYGLGENYIACHPRLLVRECDSC